MKITEAKLFPVKVYRETGMVTRHAVLKLFTDEGIVGLGEISDFGHFLIVPDLDDLERGLTEMLAGRDPFRLASIHGALAAFASSGWIGIETIAAVDFALHDIAGKALGVPVYQLLGGKCRDRIPIAYPIFNHHDISEVEGNIATVEMVYAEGFDRIRLYIGANLEADELFLRRLRERFGDKVKVKSLDMSGRLDWKEAIQVVERFEQYDFELVESAARHGDLEGMAQVRRRIKKPISEHVGSLQDGMELIKKGAVDIFNIAVLAGGIYPATKLFHLAEAAGLECLMGTTQELSIATAAGAHLGVALQQLQHPCDTVGPRLYRQDVVKSRVKYEGGYMLVPEGIGLGVELEEEELARLSEPLTAFDSYQRRRKDI